MRYAAILAGIGLLLAVAGTAGATSEWYWFTFTAADLWNYSPGYDSSVTTAENQDAPRRHHDAWKSSGITTTWLYGDGTPPGESGSVDTAYQHTTPQAGDTGFGGWAASAAGQAYQIDSFNLWGGNLSNAKQIFGEKYLSVANAADHGVSSWEITDTPAGWSGEVIPSSWLPEQGYPEWWADDGIGITQADIGDPSLVFGFKVLVANPETAFEPDGTMRIWFGGMAYDEASGAWSSEGFDGAMKLTPVPEPLTMAGLVLGIGSLATYLRRRRTAS